MYLTYTSYRNGGFTRTKPYLLYHFRLYLIIRLKKSSRKLHMNYVISYFLSIFNVSCMSRKI